MYAYIWLCITYIVAHIILYIVILQAFILIAHLIGQRRVLDISEANLQCFVRIFSDWIN